MGRINLAALRVRKRAIEKYNAGTGKGHEKGIIPNWVEVIGDIPPAQVLTRQQPIQHQIVQSRVRTIPDSGTIQHYETTASRATHKIKAGKKASRLFTPLQIKYEEDELRRQFFSDHPWELARPRVVLETTGNQYETADWSKGLKQPQIPLSGESVIQRQLWLLQNTPDLTVPESYDIARKEFYVLRRAEETRRRVAVEEAEHMGAHFEKKALVWGMDVEDKMYNDWEIWSKAQTIEQLNKNSATAGEALPAAEEEALKEMEEVEEPEESRVSARPSRPLPHNPVQAEMQRKMKSSYV